MQAFQVHALINSIALLIFLLGVYYAKRHTLKLHHLSVYSALGLLTSGVAYMVYLVGGIPSSHGKFGIFVYACLLFAGLSGRLFLGGKLKRGQHRIIAISAVLLLVLQVLMGLYSFVL
ncbi:hypothetical protein [Thermococcus stetteri]|uniref:hypothetical protein n=1 Tax=Thermococcus stetteri TaxID=49900 RepID=UPI001AE5F96F|nr:hypothetical protein [Thermococcus stetteri]MBP1911076.1 hypothetical protein [Thermococcus stetteri]